MKRKRMYLLAIVAACAAVLALALAALMHAAGGETEAGIPLCPLEAAAVDTVSYVQNGEEAALQKGADGTWVLTDDPTLPLAQGTVDAMVQGLCAMQATRALDAGAISGSAGLDAPQLSVRLTAGERAYTLTVGALNTVSQIYYVSTTESGEVYTVFSGDISGLCPSRRGLYAKESPAGLAAEDLTAMTVQNSAETLQFLYTDGTWQLAEAPQTALDQDAVARMANTACNLQTVWAYTAPGPDADYGLDAPNVTVTLTAGEKAVTLRFGATVPGEAEGDGGTCYLAADTAPGIVYETEAEHLAAFAATRAALAAEAQTDGADAGTNTDTDTGTDAAALRLREMTLEEKVGQLFFIRPDSLDGTLAQEQINDAHAAGVTAVSDAMRAALQTYPVGGVALFGKNITDEAQLRTLTADLQAASATPLFISVDEEGGAVARLANHAAFDLPQYESAAAVGAEGEAAALAMGRTIGAYLKEYGFNMDFAPVADVDLNPDNPVIGTRAFSADAEQVRTLAAAMGQGLQEQGILPVFKHFPGHGDTAEDSHYGLAVLDKTAAQLAAAEWLPYGYGTQPPLAQGSYAVMVGHIAVPSITGAGVPATFSKELVTDVLKAQLYDPLVITDSLAMQAITDAYTPGEAAVKALQAGCDVLLMPNGLAEAYDGVLAAVRDGTITEPRLDESVGRILRCKQGMGLL